MFLPQAYPQPFSGANYRGASATYYM